MNQNISKLGGQLLAIWKQLGVAQRVTVAAATLVLLLCLGALAFWSSRAEYGLLYGKLSDSESAKVIAALDDAKIPYRVGAGGSSILVPSEKVHLMRMQLAGRGIPRGDGVGFEIFDKPNFGISDFVQRANYVRAVQGELARTISQLDEIESARVMIVLPENRLLLDKDKYATASVFVRVRGNSPLPPQSINSIRFLVANAVEGLKPNHVSLVDNLGNVLSENADNDSLTGLSTTQLAARRNLEQYLGKKAQDMLEKVLGPGQAIVRIAAEINYDTVTRTEEKFDPDGAVLRSETKNDENTDLTTASAATPVGITANTVTETNTAAAPPVNNSRNRKAVATVQYEVSKSTSNMMQSAGGIKRLSAAVTVAARFEGAGATRKMVPRSPEELEKLRRIIAGALGIPTGQDNPRGDVMTLEELPFNDQFATDVTRELNEQQKHEFWWTMARNTFYPVMGLLTLLVLWRLFKRTPVQDIPIGLPIGRLMAAPNGFTNDHSNGHTNRHGQNETAPGQVSVEVLNRLIKENPANMSQAIREWLDQGRSSQS
ncbi:MAG TPA: flagellar basal-body MS-ring/collar protein FliF [Clostridia bacterium]|nr:flagellar basal-body MS-ring/collar protein FliF [Clostridia bacterium]